MDEVDFTILAATSVLGDLIAKCPPAEACRDAFDRMSKATVTMCMSTTGFSSSLAGLTTHHPTSHSRPQSQSHPDTYGHQPSKQFTTSNARGSGPQKQHAGRMKHRPKFDMGLNDLYAPTPRLAHRQSSTTQQSAEAFAIPRSNDDSPVPFSSNLQNQSQQAGPSPPMTNFAPLPHTQMGESIDPSLRQGQMQGQQGQYMPPTARLTPTNLRYLQRTPSYPPPDASAPGQGQPQGQGQDDMEVDFSHLPTFSSFPDLDFLNDPSLQPQMNQNNPNAYGPGGNGQGQMGGQNTGGIELGFGWGADGEGHDFSEGGNQLDFFDGFYFGAGVQ